MHTILVYVDVLDGIGTAIGEVGIRGSRSSHNLLVLIWHSGEGPKTATGFTRYCCKQFHFNSFRLWPREIGRSSR
jgi:hypothetical protein